MPKRFRFYWKEDQKGSGPEINIELPGFSKDEIHVSVDKGFLNISAAKKGRKVEKGKNFYKEEAFAKSFGRSMSLPEGINPNDMEIKVEDGSVRIRKKKKARV